jgi:hypothetical protein
MHGRRWIKNLDWLWFLSFEDIYSWFVFKNMFVFIINPFSTDTFTTFLKTTYQYFLNQSEAICFLIQGLHVIHLFRIWQGTFSYEFYQGRSWPLMALWGQRSYKCTFSQAPTFHSPSQCSAIKNRKFWMCQLMRIWKHYKSIIIKFFNFVYKRIMFLVGKL